MLLQHKVQSIETQTNIILSKNKLLSKGYRQKVIFNDFSIYCGGRYCFCTILYVNLSKREMISDFVSKSRYQYVSRDNNELIIRRKTFLSFVNEHAMHKFKKRIISIIRKTLYRYKISNFVFLYLLIDLFIKL